MVGLPVSPSNAHIQKRRPIRRYVPRQLRLSRVNPRQRIPKIRPARQSRPARRYNQRTPSTRPAQNPTRQTTLNAIRSSTLNSSRGIPSEPTDPPRAALGHPEEAPPRVLPHVEEKNLVLDGQLLVHGTTGQHTTKKILSKSFRTAILRGRGGGDDSPGFVGPARVVVEKLHEPGDPSGRHDDGGPLPVVSFFRHLQVPPAGILLEVQVEQLALHLQTIPSSDKVGVEWRRKGRDWAVYVRAEFPSRAPCRLE